MRLAGKERPSLVTAWPTSLPWTSYSSFLFACEILRGPSGSPSLCRACTAPRRHSLAHPSNTYRVLFYTDIDGEPELIITEGVFRSAGEGDLSLSRALRRYLLFFFSCQNGQPFMSYSISALIYTSPISIDSIYTSLPVDRH